MKVERVRLIVKGRVQGVFFRDSTRRKALQLGLSGIVRNRRDGTVEIVAEGPKEMVDEMVTWARTGPPSAVVTDVLVTGGQPTGEYSKFEVAPTI